MKIKTKLVTCVGAMVWLTVAILSSSAIAAEDRQTKYYTTDPSSLSGEAKSWCEFAMNKGANCCATATYESGHPGTLSAKNDGYNNGSKWTVCDLWTGKYYPDGTPM